MPCTAQSSGVEPSFPGELTSAPPRIAASAESLSPLRIRAARSAAPASCGSRSVIAARRNPPARMAITRSRRSLLRRCRRRLVEVEHFVLVLLVGIDHALLEILLPHGGPGPAIDVRHLILDGVARCDRPRLALHRQDVRHAFDEV